MRTEQQFNRRKSKLKKVKGKNIVEVRDRLPNSTSGLLHQEAPTTVAKKCPSLKGKRKFDILSLQESNTKNKKDESNTRKVHTEVIDDYKSASHSKKDDSIVVQRTIKKTKRSFQEEVLYKMILVGKPCNMKGLGKN